MAPCTHPSKSPNPKPGVRSEWWLPDSPFYPRYKPWNSTPDGIYVPESYFVHDVGTVLDSVFADLETIADHGPPLFRFQRENSTQFRWPTSADTYLPPHDTLPTLSLDVDEILKLASASTVLGLPPSSAGGPSPSPTARPATTRRILNLEPGILKLREQLGAALGKLGSDNIDRNDEMASFWPAIINDRGLMMHFKLDDLGGSSMDPAHDWGPDQCRVDCLYPKLTFDLVSPPLAVVSKMHREIIVFTAIPLDFIEAVRKAQVGRESQSKHRESSTTTKVESYEQLEWPTSDATATSCPSCPHPSANKPTRLLHPDGWSTAQKANGTAIELLKILNMTVDQRFEGDGDKGAPKVHDLFNYRDVHIQVCNMTRKLNDYVQQLVQVLGPGYQGTTASHPDAQWAHAKTQQALRRLHDVAPFINQVAVGQQRLGEFRREITKAVQDEWLANENTTYLHFPSLADIRRDWAATQTWLRSKANDISDIYESRDHAIASRRGQPSRDNVIWSRWGLNDARRDPMGREALYWEDGVNT
ncbi:hypothetical protein FDECE_6736 [Fusarium decemcellulare]|nr:hypothetical protein FDECE_6736 [Fusarium decemcellulare]